MCDKLLVAAPRDALHRSGAGPEGSVKPPAITSAVSHTAVNKAWRFSALPAVLRRFLLVVGLFTLSNSSNLFLLLRARQLGLADAQIPLLWATISAVAMLTSTPLSAWSDRIGRRRLLVCGYGGYGLFYLLIGHLQNGGGWLLPVFACYGLFLAATVGVEKALVADLALPDGRAAFGWFHLITGVALLPASLLFGWLHETFSPSFAFTISAVVALAAAALLALVPLPTTAPMRQIS